MVDSGVRCKGTMVVYGVVFLRIGLEGYWAKSFAECLLEFCYGVFLIGSTFDEV